jgi:hypothetical protein
VSLAPGARLDGPAIIDQADSTTVVPPRAAVEVDQEGNLIIATLAGVASGDPVSVATSTAGND